MRVSQSTASKAAQAAEVYARTKNLSETARELGVHRSTLDRWKREGLLDSERISVRTDLSLDSMVDKALRVIDQALDGDGIKPNQIRAALEVVKASNTFRAQERAEEAQQTLAELIAIESDSD